LRPARLAFAADYLRWNNIRRGNNLYGLDVRQWMVSALARGRRESSERRRAMFCSECGAVFAPGPIETRRANHGGGTIDCPPALLQRLWRWIAALRFVPKMIGEGGARDAL
jgi:hypothetical protein